RRQIERKIKDRRIVNLIMLFMCSAGDDGIGLPIGALLSQLNSLINLNELDHYVKRELKVRLYCRYMDDFVLFGLPRQECVELQRKIEAFLLERLNLRLSKWSIAPISRGINFVGYRTWRSRRF